MKTLVILLSVSLLSWFGWWLGAWFGMMTGYVTSFVGSLIGVYVGVRINREFMGCRHYRPLILPGTTKRHPLVFVGAFLLPYTITKYYFQDRTLILSIHYREKQAGDVLVSMPLLHHGLLLPSP